MSRVKDFAFLFAVFATSCTSTNSEYEETIATIMVEKYEDYYITMITYEVSEFIGGDGKPHNVIQQIWNEKKEPVDGQRIRIRYRKDENIFWKPIDKIAYKTDE
ncbi:MAG: hypothetical protein LBJ89_02700 [Holosporales bacterium]|jgi:hypothetical protein|nr:hypothetical protein [Holosporales bacterium]